MEGVGGGEGGGKGSKASGGGAVKGGHVWIFYPELVALHLICIVKEGGKRPNHFVVWGRGTGTPHSYMHAVKAERQDAQAHVRGQGIAAAD